MFEAITRRFSGILGSLHRKKITEKNIRETLREIRVALLEADVAFEVVKDFLARVEEEALGEKVLKGVKPGEQFVYVLYQHLVELMGPVDTTLEQKASPAVILMAGLQGSGKTTTCAKLAVHVRQKYKRKPLLVAADVQRPAAIDQLKTLGRQINVPVFAEAGEKPPAICKHAIQQAAKMGCNTVILDTAGRLHIDEEMMAEVRDVARVSKPHEVFLVCDAMIGQDAVRSAREFNEQLELTGVILTKLDGDARGGAALSVKAVTGKPIKFIGVGEKLEDTLEEFRPEGMAQRILGGGDMAALVDKVGSVVSQEEAAQMQEKLLQNRFTLADFLSNLKTVKKLGNVKKLLEMVPGIGAHVGDMDIDDKDLAHVEAIIQSMTPKERLRPEILNTSRRDRIAHGCGISRVEIDDLLKQFNGMKKMMDQVSRVGGKGPLGKIKALASARREMADLGGMMQKMATATQPRDPALARARKGPPQPRLSKEEIKRRRKRERQNRRKNRKR